MPRGQTPRHVRTGSVSGPDLSWRCRSHPSSGVRNRVRRIVAFGRVSGSDPGTWPEGPCPCARGGTPAARFGYRQAVSDTAVVVMAYGSPERLDDVPAYYADIRGGRPIAPENLADLVERYRRLGIEDSSPLNAITERTRAALEQELGIPVVTGVKHWPTRDADAAAAA